MMYSTGLQYLDVDKYSRMLTYMSQSLPTMPYVQSFMVNLWDAIGYQMLMKILNTCQRTMDTSTSNKIYISELHYFKLDDLDINHKHLKTFRPEVGDISLFQSTAFGDNHENLC